MREYDENMKWDLAGIAFMVCILLCVIYEKISFGTVAQQIMKKKQNRHYCVNICFCN
jgi:hypothetical protein